MSGFPFQVVMPTAVAQRKVERLVTAEKLHRPDANQTILIEVANALMRYPNRINRITIDADDGITVDYLEESHG